MNFNDWPNRSLGSEFICRDDCGRLLVDASQSERKRSHILLHDSHSDPVQRLVVALDRETYIQPHMHSEQWEMIVPLWGALSVFLFSEDGAILAKRNITADEIPLFQIPAGTWHSIAPATDTAVILEVKAGPFRAAQFSSWSPAESSPDASLFYNWLTDAETGDRWRYRS